MGTEKKPTQANPCSKCGKVIEEIYPGTSTATSSCKCKKEKPKSNSFICPVCGHGKSPITGYCNCNNHW